MHGAGDTSHGLGFLHHQRITTERYLGVRHRGITAKVLVGKTCENCVFQEFIVLDKVIVFTGLTWSLREYIRLIWMNSMVFVAINRLKLVCREAVSVELLKDLTNYL